VPRLVSVRYLHVRVGRNAFQLGLQDNVARRLLHLAFPGSIPTTPVSYCWFSSPVKNQFQKCKEHGGSA